MTKEEQKHIVSLVNSVFKENVENMLKKCEEKYTEVVRERATNDIHNQNFAVKQQYPEKCFLSFVLKNGEFVVPYEVGTKLTLEFTGCGLKETILQIDTAKDEMLDITKVLDLCKHYDYCKVTTVTATDVVLFDEEELEKNDKVVRCDNEWKQTFEGFYTCADVIGAYQTVSKFYKKVEAQA